MKDGDLAYEIGRRFCEDRIIVSVESEWEASELLAACKLYSCYRDNYPLNSHNTNYELGIGRAYRFDKQYNVPKKGSVGEYKKYIAAGGSFEGYMIISYAQICSECESSLTEEAFNQADVDSVLDSIIKCL